MTDVGTTFRKQLRQIHVELDGLRELAPSGEIEAQLGQAQHNLDRAIDLHESLEEAIEGADE